MDNLFVLCISPFIIGVVLLLLNTLSFSQSKMPMI